MATTFYPTYQTWYDVYGGGTGITPKLAAPTNFRQTARTTTSVTLAWNASPNATSYVLRNVTTNASFPVSTTSYQQSGLSTDSSYIYEVVALASGYTNSDASAQASATTGDSSTAGYQSTYTETAPAAA